MTRRRCSPFGAGLLTAILVAGGLGCDSAGTGEAPPPILLVVLDTVRADRTSTYGYARPTTIQLDAVADAGVVFRDATAPACWTWPSHASLFTGTPPWVHGARLIGGAASGGAGVEGLEVSALRPELPTLAERLRAAGYDTRAAVANEWLRPELGLTRGFERVVHHPADAEVTRVAEDEIVRERARPLFLFVNYLSAHSPYREGPGPWSADGRLDPPSPGLEPYLTEDAPRGINLARRAEGDDRDGYTRFLAGELQLVPRDLETLGALYDAGVRGADFSLGRLLTAWTRRFPDGVVAVTADHGEALGEHGQLYHLGSVYPEVLRIPLVLAAPGRLPAGVEVAAPVQLQDLYATLLELAGVERSEGSLLRAIEAAEAGEAWSRPVAAAAWPNAFWASELGGRYRHAWRLYREPGYALVWSDEGDAELYDARLDPGMLRDLAAEQPERTAELLTRAREHFGEVETVEPQALEISDELREQLKALGYGH